MKIEDQQFDLVIIGSGAGASNAAYECRSAGWSVAVVDSQPFGGTCANRGCDPKKVLVGAAELADWNRRMAGYGIPEGAAHIEWPELMRFKRTFTDRVPENRKAAFEKAGIVPFQGRARFVDKTTLEIGKQRLTGRFVLIAAGARPMPLNIPGEIYLTDSTRFLDTPDLPEKILFIGGGYISFEFAHMAARAGAHVTLLHRSGRALKGFEPYLVDMVLDATRGIGIDLHLDSPVTAVNKAGHMFRIHASEDGKDKVFEAGMVVHGAGRVPDIDDMDLDKAGVEWGRKGVIVNEYLQSVSNPAFYAAGDAAASPGMPLTPVGGYESRMAAANILKSNHRTADYRGTPTVVFTLPALASVGLKEKEALAKGLKFQAKEGETVGWYVSKRVREQHGGFKILVEEGTGRILGAHLLGPHAEEIINLFALAIRNNIPATELAHMIYAYPTSASNIPYMIP